MRSHAEIEALVARGRAAAEVLMTDHVRVWRDSPGESSSDDWGHVTRPDPELRYEGPAKAQNDRTYPSAPDIADTARKTLIVSSVHFPHGTTSVGAGDVVEFVRSANPRLIGQRLRLRSDEDKTHQTAVRFNVEEVVS